VPEDWAAVAAAIDTRVRELGWRQRELSERANVSHAIVREIQHHVVERRRSTRTLEALSTALGWPPSYLHSVLHGQPSAQISSPEAAEDTHALRARLEKLEDRLAAIEARLDDIHGDLRIVVDNTLKDQ
jgi:transcriptional regulator with XRE-family HTH domain